MRVCAACEWAYRKCKKTKKRINKPSEMFNNRNNYYTFAIRKVVIV